MYNTNNYNLNFVYMYIYIVYFMFHLKYFMPIQHGSSKLLLVSF